MQAKAARSSAREGVSVERIRSQKNGNATSLGWARVSLELERARRCESKFVLARLSPVALKLVRRTKRATRLQPDAVVAEIASRMRSVDCVWRDGPSVYVLACDTDLVHSTPLIRRLSLELPELVEGRQITLACFPDDALTYDELIDAADTLPAARLGSALAQ